MKQLFAILTLFALVGVVSCGGDNQPPAEQKKDAGAATAPQAPASQNQKTVIVIAKSYQNQFYQAAFKGAEKAAVDLGVRLTTNGPDAESNVSQQVDQVAAAINQKPDALVHSHARRLLLPEPENPVRIPDRVFPSIHNTEDSCTFSKL